MSKKRANTYWGYIIWLNKKATQKKKYLRSIFSSHVPPKDGQHLLQKLSKEANIVVSTLELYSAQSKANNEILHKTKTKTFSKRHYKAR